MVERDEPRQVLIDGPALPGGPAGPAGDPDPVGPATNRPAAEPEPGPGPGRPSLARAVFAPESLAVTGFVLSIVSVLAPNVFTAAAMSIAGMSQFPASDVPADSGGLHAAYGAVTAGVALLGAAVGIAALLPARPAQRAWIALAGAAVLVGLLSAAAHLYVAAMIQMPAYYPG